MRTKGDGVGKSGREKHGEKGTRAWKLQRGHSDEGTDGVRARLPHRSFHSLRVSKEQKLF